MWSLSYQDVKYAFKHISVTSVAIAGRAYRVDDAPAPRADGVMFGRDFADPGDVELDVLVSFQHVRNLGMQRAMLQEAAYGFLKSWDAAALRGEVGASGELVIPTLGMVEGRPRRAEWDWSTYGLGYLTGKATFVRSTMELYAIDSKGNAGWHQAVLNLASAPIGGLRSPLRSPLRTAVETVQVKPVVVAGSSPVRPVIEIKGPVQAGARLERPGKWRLYLNRGLTASQTVRIDTRAGRAATFLNNKPVQVLDPRSSMLADCVLRPGSNVIALKGVSFDGTVRVTVRWRDVKEAF